MAEGGSGELALVVVSAAREPLDAPAVARLASVARGASACGVATMAVALSAWLAASPALAQDPSSTIKSSATAAEIGSSISPPAFSSSSRKGLFGDVTPPDKTQPLYLQGDQLVYDNAGTSVVARGNVEIYYSNYVLTADEVIYDQSAQTLTAAGNVVLKEPNGNVIRADRYTLTDDFRDGFVQSLSVVSRDETRIAAERATRREGNVTEFTNGKFTPCKSEGGMPPLWCISANRVIHDTQAATITYQDAQFELFGQPVIYLPYFQHADPSVKRKSGLLPPKFGSSSSSLGFFTEVPYYFALSPNFDFLFHPMYSAKQGVMWQGEWRHRLANGEYSVKVAGIDQDIGGLPTGATNREDLEGFRGSVETHGRFSLGSWWNFGWDAIVESDEEFRRFYKLDNVLLTDRVNEVYLEGISERNYLGIRMYQLGGLTFQDTDTSNALVHPVIDHNYVFAEPVLGGELRWNSNVLSLSRDGTFGASRDVHHDLTRAVTELKWRRQVTDPIGITYTPFANVRADAYSYGGYNNSDTAVDESTSFLRGIAAGGATISYPWVANTSVGAHVVEPIGQIIVRQAHVQQTELPVEDARSLIFDDTTLFEVDKFSGYDRVETGTRANVGLQYTFQSNDGGYARFIAGQSYHLGGENPYAADPGENFDGQSNYAAASGLETDRSDYVLGAYLAPSNVFRMITQARLDEKSLSLRRMDAGAQVDVGPLAAALSYTFSTVDPQTLDDDQQDITAALGFRLTDNWSVIGRMRYDIDDASRLTDSVSLTYSDECFILTVTYQESFIRDADRSIVPDQSVLVSFQFKHLGGYQYATDSLNTVFGQ